MPIYLDSPDDARRTAEAFFCDLERRVNNQRIFDAVKHVQKCAAERAEMPRYAKSENHSEGGK